MIRELCLKTLLIVLFVSIMILGNILFASAQTTADSSLIVKIMPSVIEAGEKSHKIGYVGFTNKDGNLIKVTKDTTVSLASESPNVVKVPSEITIPVGSKFAEFNVTSTSEIGTAKIFASYEDSLVFDVITVGTSQEEFENNLRLVVNLPTSDMNVESEMPFSLYLEDADGNVSQAPFDIAISLEYEKDLVVVNIDDPVIKKGNSYIWGTVKSKDKVGNAFLRATADKMGFDEAKEIRISSTLPSSLQVKIFPEQVPATLKRDVDIVVSLVDSDGLPTFAQDDVGLKFFSDDPSINNQLDRAIKEQSIKAVIKKGDFSFHFRQRFDLPKEGQTITIGATTKGLGVAQDTFQTVEPFTTNNPLAQNKTMQVFTLDKIPTKSETIAIFQIGALIDTSINSTSADSTDGTETTTTEKVFHPLIVNENYDSIGSEQNVGMISSNDMLLRIKELGKIDKTSSYGTSVIETGQETGQVVLSTTIKGIGAASTQTEIINTLKQEHTLIFSPTGTQSVLFDKNGYFDLFLISLDSKNRPTAVENEVRYLVTPINEIISIQKDTTYSHVTFLGNSIQSDQEQIAMKAVPVGESADSALESQNTFAKKPTAKLIVEMPFSLLNSEKTQYIGTVQLFDFHEHPVSLSSDLRVKIAPSETGIVDIPEYVTIPSGVSYAEFPIETKGKDGSATIDASSRGIVGSKADIQTKSAIVKLKISIGSVEEPIPVDQPTELTVYVDDEQEHSVGGATIRVTADGSSLEKNTVKTNPDGSAVIQFNAQKAPKTSLQIFASAQGYSEDQRDFEFTVEEAVVDDKTILPDWVIYGGIGGVAAIVGGVVIFLRKPKLQMEDEDELYE